MEQVVHAQHREVMRVVDYAKHVQQLEQMEQTGQLATRFKISVAVQQLRTLPLKSLLLITCGPAGQ